MCTKLAFLKFWGGLKVEGRLILEVSGFVKLLWSAPRAVAAKERTAVAIVNGFMLKKAGQPEKKGRVRCRIPRKSVLRILWKFTRNSGVQAQWLQADDSKAGEGVLKADKPSQFGMWLVYFHVTIMWLCGAELRPFKSKEKRDARLQVDDACTSFHVLHFHISPNSETLGEHGCSSRFDQKSPTFFLQMR